MEYFVIDRIEEAIAVLEKEDGSHFSVPTENLYSDAKEGDVIYLQEGHYCVDPEETQRRRAKANALLEELFGG